MTVSDLKKILQSLGIFSGDKILVSSEIMKMLIQLAGEDQEKLRNRAEMTMLLDKIIDCLQEVVGETGTLLFPTFNWGFCKGRAFDYCKTLGQTGILSNRALVRTDFKRTCHPIYSFAVWGKGTEELVSLQNKSSFGEDSPFAWLHRHKGKNLVIDASGYFTFLHYVEEKFGVPYRYIKDFSADYKDKNGNVSNRSYSMYVRDLDLNFIADNEGIEKVLLGHDVMSIKIVNDIRFCLICFDEAFYWLKDEIQNNQAKNLMKWL